jgi:hypothetical protein
MGIIAWIVLGLLAGTIARALIPGRTEPGGCIEHFDRLPKEIKELGVMRFASYPPSNMDNAITRLWDKHARSDWREISKDQEEKLGKPRDAVTDQETLSELTGQLSSAQPISDQEAGSQAADPDYIVITRMVPAKKGKWQMVSKDVEEAGNKD